MRGERALGPLTAEEGFAALVTIERDGRTHQLLFDAGYSPDGPAGNMRRLEVDPTRIEAVVLGHGQRDHVTGLDGLTR